MCERGNMSSPTRCAVTRTTTTLECCIGVRMRYRGGYTGKGVWKVVVNVRVLFTKEKNREV